VSASVDAGDATDINMSATATIKDIAREAGVSGASDSLSFSTHPCISGVIREKVLKIALPLKFSPNLPVRILRSSGIRATHPRSLRSPNPYENSTNKSIAC
jgi:DNA-binding LacI/PurR family transcriptional regulator